MTTRTLNRLERITARTALAAVAFTVTAWTLYIAIGGLAS